MKVLLTNDDSHRSPLLASIIHYLKRDHELLVVVPKHEQSWRSKCMTRFGFIHREDLEIAGYPAVSLDGSPADCVNIAIHHFYPSGKGPDFVVSGINAGLNIGTGFIWSSGTVGACLEANIAGVPAIALSQEFDIETRNKYAAEYSMNKEVILRLERQTESILDRVLPRLTSGPLFEKSITWNINFPFHLQNNFDLSISPMAPSRYGSCFRRTEVTQMEGQQISRFEHDLIDVYPNAAQGSDAERLRSGSVTITPLDIFSFGQVPEAEHKRLKKVLCGE
ncbi:MAG: 5'/3'-nucleotidase SurE [Deltaproteobacteria bacterium]|nr:5'/3'-nucleotidase SurE [Deltaproteobacteria bacterium]